jgi:hypothetical protein
MVLFLALLFPIAFVALCIIFFLIIKDIIFIIRDKENKNLNWANPLKIIFQTENLSQNSLAKRDRLIRMYKYLFAFWIVFMLFSYIRE